MAHDDKTEHATPRRRQKARERGQVARSRDLSTSLLTFTGVLLIGWVSPGQLNLWRSSFRNWTEFAVRDSFTPSTRLLEWAAIAALRWIVVPVAAVWMLAVVSSLAQGGLVLAPSAMAPKPERLSPSTKLSQMFSVTGLSATAKSLLPFSVLLYLGVSIFVRDWTTFLGAGTLPAAAIAGLAWQRAMELCWKSTLVLLVWAVLDYFLQRHKFERDLRMSKQELRDEYKETDGNPSIKARIRRLQRQVRRRRTLKEVERATVVVTNPTHFAVALEYRPEMAAPSVVAKGCDLLAEQIKQVARWHEIPLVENRPLAQALYRSVEVGQTIPAKLYAAVAEILAYIYRAQMRLQNSTAGVRRN
jgi:flagellar biosynthetic protein FlhB